MRDRGNFAGVICGRARCPHCAANLYEMPTAPRDRTTGPHHGTRNGKRARDRTTGVRDAHCSGWRAAMGDVRAYWRGMASLACVIMVRSLGRTAGGVVPDAAHCAAIGGAQRRPRKTLSVCYFAKPRPAVATGCRGLVRGGNGARARGHGRSVCTTTGCSGANRETRRPSIAPFRNGTAQQARDVRGFGGRRRERRAAMGE